MYAKQGLLVHVYRSDRPSGLNSLTAKNTSLVLLALEGADSLGPFDPDDRTPAMYLAQYKGRTIALPEIPGAANITGVALYSKGEHGHEASMPVLRHLGGWQVGGNFIYTSDSRFPAGAPIHVYDRNEGRGII